MNPQVSDFPCFTKGLTQLSPIDVEKTRKIANPEDSCGTSNWCH